MTNTYIKLLIGLILFGALVALTVLQVPNADRLLDLIYAALVGLGIYHLGDRDGAPPSKEGGFALPGLLAALGLGSALMLAGCATNPAGLTPAQSTQATFAQGCAAYGAAFAVALELRRADKLSKPQIDQITLLDSQVTPLCTGPLPVDPAQAAQQVTAAVTTLAILEAIKETK